MLVEQILWIARYSLSFDSTCEDANVNNYLFVSSLDFN